MGWPGRPARRIAAAALCVTLSGCGGASTASSDPDPGPDPGRTREASGAPDTPAPDTPAPGTPAPTPDPPAPPSVPGPCDPAVEAAAAATVAAQLDALAAGDFAAAHAWASPFFRTVVQLERFETLIRDGYPELLDVAARRLEGCAARGRRAVLVVGITTGSGATRTLAYELSDTDEGWRIDGAQDAVPPGLAPAPPAAPQV